MDGSAQEMMKYAIYQTGPLFTAAEQAWHRDLSAQLRAAGHSVIWPGSSLMGNKQICEAWPNALGLIFNTGLHALSHCNCVVALLGGTHVDDGTAWEIGYAYAKGLPIYGINTDYRVAGGTRHIRVNSMIEECLTQMVNDIPNLLQCLQKKR
ncbi:MAG: nucleoside 2-deoxyribosyltransferase [Deltaproteobacteria bacterium]|jgi:nucleoside 2-deoxyribosyltransferase|nr:nucleoside 2-deoxyribosyltransferase [Deltaproteobacteria bacterium]